MQSEQIDELSKALSLAQGAMKAATFNKVNPHFKNKYADLAAVWDAIRGPLSQNGLSITQTMEPIQDVGLFLRTTLRHSSGQWVASLYPLPQAAQPQQLGSALTYARRYSLSSIVGIAADEDDDANQAQKANGKSATEKYGTTVADVIGRELEYDENGQVVDGIPNPDDGITKLAKSQCREDHVKCLTELRALGTEKALKDWAHKNRNRIGSYPDDWWMMFQGVFLDKLADVRRVT